MRCLGWGGCVGFPGEKALEDLAYVEATGTTIMQWFFSAALRSWKCPFSMSVMKCHMAKSSGIA